MLGLSIFIMNSLAILSKWESRFVTGQERSGLTDRQTDRQADYVHVIQINVDTSLNLYKV